MKRKRFDEGGEVEDYEKTAADYDDERAEDTLQMRIAKAQAKNARPAASDPAPRTTVKPAPKSAPKSAPKPAAKPASTSASTPTAKPEAVRRPGMPTHLQGRPYNPPKPIPGYESPLSRLDRTRREEDQAKRLDIARDESPASSPTFMSLRGKGMAKGGAVSASKRADGCAQRGKTKGRII